MVKVRVNRGPAPDESQVNLYSVSNTSNNILYLVARDAHTGMSVAWTANHVYSPEVMMEEYYSRSVTRVLKPYSELVYYWDIIQQAISMRLEGTIHFDDGGVCVGDQPIG